MLGRHFFLYHSFLHKVLVGRIAQGDDAASEPMRMILRLQLHLLLLLVLMDGLKTILVQMGRLI